MPKKNLSVVSWHQCGPSSTPAQTNVFLEETQILSFFHAVFNSASSRKQIPRVRVKMRERARERRTRATNGRRRDYGDNVSRWREVSAPSGLSTPKGLKDFNLATETPRTLRWHTHTQVTATTHPPLTPHASHSPLLCHSTLPMHSALFYPLSSEKTVFVNYLLGILLYEIQRLKRKLNPLPLHTHTLHPESILLNYLRCIPISAQRNNAVLIMLTIFMKRIFFEYLRYPMSVKMLKFLHYWACTLITQPNTVLQLALQLHNGLCVHS